MYAVNTKDNWYDKLYEQQGFGRLYVRRKCGLENGHGWKSDWGDTNSATADVDNDCRGYGHSGDDAARILHQRTYRPIIFCYAAIGFECCDASS